MSNPPHTGQCEVSILGTEVKYCNEFPKQVNSPYQQNQFCPVHGYVQKSEHQANLGGNVWINTNLHMLIVQFHFVQHCHQQHSLMNVKHPMDVIPLLVGFEIQFQL